MALYYNLFSVCLNNLNFKIKIDGFFIVHNDVINDHNFFINLNGAYTNFIVNYVNNEIIIH